ncbi:MAG: type II toxin-antitoxin system RelE/ParE family toxin [Halothiobacillaceae bacterium]
MIYKLTLDAEKDLAEIYRYSYTQFGMSQADAYFDALEKPFHRHDPPP